MKLAIETMNN